MNLILKFLLFAGLTSSLLIPFILLYIYNDIQEKLDWILEVLDILSFLDEKE